MLGTHAASRLCFGCEQLGGTDWGAFDESTAVAAVTRALEQGINFFDTADVYGLGASEERLSSALGQRRHDVVIATKGGVRWTAIGERAQTTTDCSPGYIRSAVEASLRRLRIDCIPLYQLHRFDSSVPIEATLAELARLRERGLIRAIGYSNFPPEALQDAHRLIPATSVQLAYSLLDRGNLPIVEFCRANGIAVMAYGPLAQGLLTGRFRDRPHFETNDRRHRLGHFSAEGWERSRPLVDGLVAVASRRQRSPATVAIRWCLDTPGITHVIVGARAPAQVDDNAEALGWSLDPSEFFELESLGEES